jgi:hypothetical protein
VDYPRTFSITASLSNDAGDVIGRGEASLTNDISWDGPLDPETAFTWCYFNNVKIDDITDMLAVRIDAVNGRDAELAAAAGYIAIDADGARTAAIGRRVTARGPRRDYWSDPGRLTSLGVAIGTTGGIVTPPLLVSAKLTFSPFSGSFLEAGSDFGLVHGERDVQDVEYLSIAPYLHLNALSGGRIFHAYIGIGGGASFSQYTYPSESYVDPVTVITPVFDFNTGLLWTFSHSVIDLRWTVKTNFKGLDHRFTLGYGYRFGYFTERYGGKPADLTNLR